jgi:hypothetical protein
MAENQPIFEEDEEITLAQERFLLALSDFMLAVEARVYPEKADTHTELQPGDLPQFEDEVLTVIGAILLGFSQDLENGYELATVKIDESDETMLEDAVIYTRHPEELRAEVEKALK